METSSISKTFYIFNNYIINFHNINNYYYLRYIINPTTKLS